MKLILSHLCLSETEKTIVAKNLTDPAVVKYFTSLAYDIMVEIAQGEPTNGESAESYLRREAIVKGRLETLTTFLTIKAV